MIHHVGHEVADLERSARFYDAVFFALGARRMYESPEAIGWGTVTPRFWIAVRSGPGSGRGHVAFAAAGRAGVKAAWEAGLAHGGSDAGAPGPRPEYGNRSFAAALRDPDGLRVELVSGT